MRMVGDVPIGRRVHRGARVVVARRAASACLAGTAVLLAVAGCAGGQAAADVAASTSAPGRSAGTVEPSREPSRTAEPSRTSEPGSSAPYRSDRTFQKVAVPVRVRIPTIGVRSTLARLGRAPDGTVEVPRRWEQAGWYAGGFRPGQPGPAVVLGHVDSHNGRAVFYELRRLRPGATVLVDRADHTTARFRVTRVERYRKTRFPSDLVYFPTLEPSLRLVTCGGSFDPASGHYRDNVIVLATAA